MELIKIGYIKMFKKEGLTTLFGYLQKIDVNLE